MDNFANGPNVTAGLMHSTVVDQVGCPAANLHDAADRIERFGSSLDNQ